MPNAEALIAKYNAEPSGAEAAVDPSSAHPPAAGSAAASAPADAPDSSQGADVSSTNEAPLDHGVLAAKLAADRAARAAKRSRRDAAKDREEAEKTKREAADELAKWKALGKDKPWLDAVKATGHDPAKVFAEMQQEAMRAGTPEAQIAAITSKYDGEIAALKKELADEREGRESAKKEADRVRVESGFRDDFGRAAREPQFAPLLEEYEPDTLFSIANGLRAEPKKLFNAAKELGVSLTGQRGEFTMIDIFNVMRATQAAHQSRMQRRNQSAAPQTSESPVTQATQAKPTVNGTAERKAGTPTTIGNDLATSRASVKSEKELRAKMTREEWRDYVSKKHEGAK